MLARGTGGALRSSPIAPADDAYSKEGAKAHTMVGRWMAAIQRRPVTAMIVIIGLVVTVSVFVPFLVLQRMGAQHATNSNNQAFTVVGIDDNTLLDDDVSTPSATVDTPNYANPESQVPPPPPFSADGPRARLENRFRPPPRREEARNTPIVKTAPPRTNPIGAPRQPPPISTPPTPMPTPIATPPTPRPTPPPVPVQPINTGYSPQSAIPSGDYFPSVPWDMDKAEAVKAGMRHAWNGYAAHCFGQDELAPLSGRCHNWLHSGLTIIDALPTMHIMGLAQEVSRGLEWVTNSFNLNTIHATVSFFETTIRVLGGLMSMYDLSNEQVYLDRARVMGDKLFNVFQTPTGLPKAQVNLQTGASSELHWTGGSSLLAEIGTCQLEFTALSRATGEPKYERAVERAIKHMDALHKPYPGLYPIYISPNSGQFTNNKITFGAMGDSFYEYLLKMWLYNGKQEDMYKRMYVESMEGMLTHLLTVSSDGYTYIADLDNGHKVRKMDHLVCFAPGMLALGVAHGAVHGDAAQRHLQAAKDILRTCYQSYAVQPSHIGPEYMRFEPSMQPGDASYKLRPEMVESLFILYRVTGDPMYREWGWNTFQAFEQHCKVAKGYASLIDVRNPGMKEDKMESFFLAETLKYLYLLFTDQTVIPLHEKFGQAYVFNTECHPLKIRK